MCTPAVSPVTLPVTLPVSVLFIASTINVESSPNTEPVISPSNVPVAVITPANVPV